MSNETVSDILTELGTLDDPKRRAVNERHGDDHGVNLSDIRAMAKRIKPNQELSKELWSTDNTAARLVALLICKPEEFSEAELDAMLRQARARKPHDWFINYVVKKSKRADSLRQRWLDDSNPVVASAGWALTQSMIAKRSDELDLPALLDVIEAQMKDAPDRLQWEMNNTLAEIGIQHQVHRARALEIGERLEVLKDYPTPPNCTSPYAPIWITAMVSRREQAATN